MEGTGGWRTWGRGAWLISNNGSTDSETIEAGRWRLYVRAHWVAWRLQTSLGRPSWANWLIRVTPSGLNCHGRQHGRIGAALWPSGGPVDTRDEIWPMQMYKWQRCGHFKCICSFYYLTNMQTHYRISSLAHSDKLIKLQCNETIYHFAGDLLEAPSMTPSTQMILKCQHSGEQHTQTHTYTHYKYISSPG